ncbi:MAG: hypothetical protein AAF585_07685 [Verrucomicrobiota bacterium]
MGLAREWDDPETWLASVFAEANDLSEWWLGDYFQESPDPWVAVLDTLLDHENERVRQHAAAMIVAYFDRDPRPELDTLRKMLPWLEDASWVKNLNRAREEFLLLLRSVEMPEAIPGALHLFRTEQSQVGAEILAAQNYTEAIPELKALIESGELEGYKLSTFVKAVDDLGGWTAEQLADGIVASCKHRAENPRVFLDTLKAKDVWIHLAAILRRYDGGRHPLLGDVLSDLESRLDEMDPKIAYHVLRFGAFRNQSWKSKLIVHSLLTGEMKFGDLSKWLMEPGLPPDDFDALIAQGGHATGLGAVFQRDQKLANQILESDDAEAIVATLAAARYIHMKLDRGLVEALQDSAAVRTKEAAGIYLGSVADVPEFKPKELLEAELRNIPNFRVPWREFVGEDGIADESFILTSGGGWGDDGDFYVLLEGDEAMLIRNPREGRMGYAIVVAEDVSTLTGYVREYELRNLPSFDNGAMDGIWYNFIHQTNRDLYGVYINNPPTLAVGYHRYDPPPVIYGELIVSFYRLFREIDINVAFGGETKNLVDNTNRVQSVWGDENGIRVRASPSSKPNWFHLKNGALAGPADPPPGRPFLDQQRDFRSGLRSPSSHNIRYQWQIRQGDAFIRRAGHAESGKSGIWRTKPGEEPELIAEGHLHKPLTQPNGPWVVATRLPETVVRINADTGEVFDASTESIRLFEPFFWSEIHNRFVIGGAGGGFLLDPESGELEPIDGDVWPLIRISWRPLQPTGNENEVWAAKNGSDEVIVGRYDLEKFKFEEVLKIPNANFESMDMWVDEAGGRILAVVDRSLIEIGFTP